MTNNGDFIYKNFYYLEIKYKIELFIKNISSLFNNNFIFIIFL